jgi:hypothetical protein
VEEEHGSEGAKEAARHEPRVRARGDVDDGEAADVAVVDRAPLYDFAARRIIAVPTGVVAPFPTA